jgi:ABC-2 type transport system permease protein
MRLSQAWIIASKDLSTFRKKRSIFYSVILAPLFMAIGLPLIIHLISPQIPADGLSGLLTVINAFAFFFIILAGTLPTAIAAYSIIGEKQEQSLEPLLATPTTDGEVLLGKSIGSLLPPLVAIWLSSILFMGLIDSFTAGDLGYLYFPNWNMAVIMLLLVPLSAVAAVELNVIISSRVNDVRTAQQFGSLIVIPFAVIYVLGEINAFPLTVPYLLILSGIILLIDIGLFYLSTATFQRDEILTNWR